ncbi:SpoIID/LytB domain-containing protein [Zhihengliuella flava]|uniref:SpoIID/LytB domain protein n=1 Tax=Zhihengliuella flava TaxID=1285193 RepID=A0A931GHT9_9MICC|nr:SpoIID/LytB domain-containing protein [Zhihengliuella flava]MBG6083586.1 SpoIID/LytB domain protein [Zhihengliuella flava]
MRIFATRRLPDHTGPARLPRRRRLLAGFLAVGLGVSAVAGTAAPAAASVPSSFEFDGAGWGHGVGMSQYGAQGQALDGWNYEQILEYYYAPASLVTSKLRAAENIKVQLLHAQSTTLVPTNGAMRLSINGQWHRTTSSVQLRLVEGKIEANFGDMTPNDGKDEEKVLNASSVGIQWQNTRFWTEGSQQTTLKVAGANSGSTGEYRHGSMRAEVLGGKINLVNTLRMNDEYLYGLAEVPSSWQTAALAAQAVAGRSYALRNMGSLKSNCNCHVYDSVTSQKFTGWAKENEGTNGVYGKKWKNAVDGTVIFSSQGVPTASRVMMYAGYPIDAVYHSSSGGHTRNSESVWTSAVPYLKSHPDPWSLASTNPNSTWSASVSQAKMRSAFGLPDVATVQLRHGADDAVASVTATSSGGVSKTLSKDAVRWALGLKSAFYGEPPTFTDIQGTTFERYVEWLAGEGITSGYTDGTFRPQQYVARYEMATFLYRYSSPNFPEPSADVFTDVPEGHSYAQEIGWTADRGITSGYTDGRFGLRDTITRGQMAAFLYAYTQNVCGKDRGFTAPTNSAFTDVRPGGAFYEAISWLNSTSITGGFGDGTYRSSKSTTRGEMAAFLYRLDSYTGGPC